VTITGNAYVVAAVRTAGGRRGGSLSSWHPADLAGFVLDAVLDRSGVPAEAIDDVILGCVSQVGPQTSNIARTAIMSSRLPDSVPGVTVDRQCGSSLQATQFAAQAVLSGTADLVVAGGVESMSMVPILSAITVGMDAGMPSPYAGERIAKAYPDENFDQFNGAERVGAKYGVTREELIDFAIASHERAIAARDAGRFLEEIVPVPVTREDGTVDSFAADEGIRQPDRQKIESLPALRPGGLVNAATSSQVTDGASAVLVASQAAVDRYGLRPLARIVAMDAVGSDPVMVLEGPIPATVRVLAKAGLQISDIDLYEVNEAFGTVPLAWAKAVGADLSRLNVNGGAQALGHPLGATGTKLLGTLIYELRRRGGRYGLIAICEGLGTANSMIIEVVPS